MGIYEKSLFDTNFPASKPLKKRELCFNIDGHELTVRIKPESALKRSFDKVDYYDKCDMYEALNNYMSRSDVIQRDDPNLHVEAYLYRPEVKKSVSLLTDEEIEKRFQFICNAYRVLANDSIVEAIVRFAEKKKNGTFYKKRYTRIFSSAIVTRDFYTFCIFGYAKSDTELEIKGDWVDFEKEINYVDKDFLSLNPGILSGQFNVSDVKKTEKKEKPKLWDITYSPAHGSDIVFKVNLREDNATLFLGNTPIESFKCLKKGKKGYAVEVSLPAFENQIGRKYGELEVGEYYYGLSHVFDWCFDLLEDYTFSPIDDDLISYRSILENYLTSHEDRKAYEISDWPEGLETYSGKYSLEESMELLLKWVDEIMSITPEQVQSFIDDLPKNQKGAIKVNKNYTLMKAPFYLPRSKKNTRYTANRKKAEKYDSFSSIYYGGQPGLGIRTPMNYPKKEIYFMFGIFRLNDE